MDARQREEEREERRVRMQSNKVLEHTLLPPSPRTRRSLLHSDSQMLGHSVHPSDLGNSSSCPHSVERLVRISTTPT